jgi:hypothetical protein
MAAQETQQTVSQRSYCTNPDLDAATSTFLGHSCVKIEVYTIAQAGENRTSPEAYVTGIK